MSVAAPVAGSNATSQTGADNPALNERAFQRGVDQIGQSGRTMSAVGTYAKTLFLLALLVAAAAFGWSEVQVITVDNTVVMVPPAWIWLAFLLTMVIGFAAIFAYRAIALLAMGYALCQGALLGVASHFYNLAFDGIVLQAVLTTVCVFGATLLLYLLNIIKVTARFKIGVMVAMAGLSMLYFVAWLFSLFGIHFSFLTQPTALGIGFSLVVVLLGALNLPLDFEFIRQASARGAPKAMEWYGAYGLMLSIIWMYVSILRLLALVRLSRS